MSRYTKLGKNIGLIGIGSIASKALVFFLLPLYTAVLTPEEYGIADTITISVKLAMPVFLIMIYDGVMRYALDNETDKKDVFSFGLNMVLVGFALSQVFSPALRLIDVINNYYWQFSALFLTNALYLFLSYFCRGIERVGIYAIGGLVATVSIVGFNIFFLLVLKIGLEGYFLAFIISFAIADVFLLFAASLWKYYKPPQKIDLSLSKKMIRYSAPLVMNQASWWISNYAARYILILLVGYSAAGIFAVSYKIALILWVFGVIFSTAWRISAVEDFGSSETKKFYKNIFDLYTTFCFCLAAVLILLSKFIGSILYAKDFFIAWQFSPFLIMGASSYKLAEFMMSIYTSSKKTMNIIFASMSGAVVCTAASFVLINLYGIQGASIATLLGHLTILVFCLIDTRKIMTFDLDLKANIPCFLLLLFEAVIVIWDLKFSFVIALIPVCAIFLIKRKSLNVVINVLLEKAKALKSKEVFTDN